MRLPGSQVICAAAAAALAVAGTTDDRVPESRYVEYAEGFAPFVAEVSVPLGGGRFADGTATIIADHWAITAAHVVKGGTSAALKYAGKKATADFFVVANDGIDIALLHSPEPFGLEFYPPLSDGDEEPGDVVSICGYGVRGPMSRGYRDGTSGVLLAGSNVIDRVERGVIVCTISPGGSELEFGIAPGDSGGPLFCRGKLAGINSVTTSCQWVPVSRAGEESEHVLVAPHRGWIDGVVTK